MGKRDRQGHDWVAMATYELTPAEAKRWAREQGARAVAAQVVGLPQLVGLHVACWACGQPYGRAHGTTCQGGRGRMTQAPSRRTSLREQKHG